MTDELKTFWASQEKQKEKRGGDGDDSFTRIDQQEKSVEIYKPKSESSKSKHSASKVWDDEQNIVDPGQIMVDDVDNSSQKE